MRLLFLLLTLFPPDSSYSSPALRAFVARVAAANRVVPVTLAGYRARAESEIALLVGRPDGLEAAAQVEQVASTVSWRRSGAYGQRVIGYRARSLGAGLSALSVLDGAFTVPALYGNRISLFFGGDTSRRRHGTGARAVHPFAPDRESVYHFSGGDTVATLRTRTGAIPLVRIHVTPAPEARPRRETMLFSGDVDVDAERFQIVRMRGRFLSVGGRVPLVRRLARAAVRTLAYAELENALVEERYWLPSYQRLELQAIPALAESRSTLRILTRFSSYVLDTLDTRDPFAALDTLDTRDARDALGALGALGTLGTLGTLGSTRDSAAAVRVESAPSGAAARADTLVALPHRLTYAPADSIRAYRGWTREPGAATAATSARDFDDLAPVAMRRTGAPVVSLGAERLSDMLRYDRVEGLYTGVAGTLRMRDASPGLTLRARSGWAWAEGAARGGVEGELRRGTWTLGAVAERALQSTNDFASSLDQGPGVSALLGVDDYDYVDRRLAAVSVARALGARASVRLEAGWGVDRGASRHVTAPPLGGDTFRVNRPVAVGSYARTGVVLELAGAGTGEFLQPGLGAVLRYERGDGELSWQRVEARLTVRRSRGPLTLATRVDAGMLASDRPPPQQIFELGRSGGLPGYDYKEFAGDRAVLARGMLMWTLPVWRSPVRLGRFVLPAIAPAPSVGLQAGWTGASAAARRTFAELNALTPVSAGGESVWRTTDGVRATVDVRLRFFGGGVSIGAARALEPGARWRLVGSLGGVF